MALSIVLLHWIGPHSAPTRWMRILGSRYSLMLTESQYRRDKQQNCQHHGRCDPPPAAQQDGLVGNRQVEHGAEGWNVHVYQAKNGKRHFQPDCPGHIVNQGGENQRRSEWHIFVQYQSDRTCIRKGWRCR